MSGHTDIDLVAERQPVDGLECDIQVEEQFQLDNNGFFVTSQGKDIAVLNFSLDLVALLLEEGLQGRNG